MRTIYRLIVLAAFAVCVGFSVKADVSPFFDAEKGHVPRSTEQRVGQRAVLAQGAVELQKAELGKVTQKIDKKRTPVRRAGEITAFTNPVIQINYSAGGVFNATHETQITLGESTIEIKNFNAMGETIKGTLNRATGEVEFPVQTAYNSGTYGRCVLASLTDDLKKFDTTATVKGEIVNGVLTLRKWCVLITTGDFKNYTFGMVESAKFVSANAKMNSASLDTTNAVVNVSQSVYAEQTADNEITIFNAAGLSCMLRVQMKSDKTLAMRPQVLFTFNNKYFYNYKADYAAGLIYKRDQIVGTTEGNKLSWGNWIICNAAGDWAFRAKSTEIQLPFDIKYPAAQTQTGWKGSGTADDPWLIETPADLLALSDSVNYVSGVQVSARCYKAFEGKYFKQTKAINLSGINFPPIGGFDEMYRFAGHYDGGNKIISNLYVNSGKAGDAALFGAVDTVASIKNVKMTNPKVIDEYMYAGTVAAYCQGTLENITVTNGDVTSIHCAGGVAGCSGPASNVSFTGNVKGESQIGGVFGVLRWPGKNLVATNTTVTGTSKQETSSVGGVVGFLGHECGGKLTDSYFSGDVVPTYNGQYAGLVAGVSSEGIFERCFGIGTIHQPTNGVSASGLGGVVGGIQGTIMKDCYFAGNLETSGTRTGAIVGVALNAYDMEGHRNQNELTNVYASGVFKSTSTEAYMPYIGKFDASTLGKAPAITNAYFDRQINPNYKELNGALPTSQLAAASLEGFADSVWVFEAGRYPRLKGMEKTAAAYVAAAPIQFADDNQNVLQVSTDFTASILNSVKWQVLRDGVASSEGVGVNIDTKGNIHLTGSVSTDTLQASSGKIVKRIIIKLAPATLFEGKGTEAEPYLIKNKADLMLLASATTKNQLSFEGTYFKVTNDIDLERDPEFVGIGINNSRTYGFAGILDGDGHKITNLYLDKCKLADNGTVPADQRTKYTALVGILKEVGVIKNLRLYGDITGYSNVAGFAGYSYGTILNCRNYANVTAHSGNLGGICGYNEKGTIRDCYNAGKITAGYFNAGGIVACNKGTIENCQNDGEVAVENINTAYEYKKLNSAGGIVETNFGTIKNVLNTGYVHAPKYVGGIQAWFNGTVTQVMQSSTLNVGMLWTGNTDNANAIGNCIGKLYKKGILEYSYYDRQLSTFSTAHGADYEGGMGVTTAELTSGKPIEGLDTAYWAFEKGQYPTLKTFADEAGAKAGALSVAFFDTNARADSIKTDVSLKKADGLVWSVVKGTDAFTVKDGNTLWMDAAPVLTDTLVATYNGFVKRIPVAAVPDTVPLPTIAYNPHDNKITFADEMEGVTYYYTLDGTEPSVETSASTTEPVSAPVATTIIVKVIAGKHNYYASAVAKAEFATTGVTDLGVGKTVASQTYVTPSGIVSATPVAGVNVVVTVYTDGTRAVTKKVFKVK